MRINSHIYDVKFRYPTKFGRYTNLSSDIPELYDIRLGRNKRCQAD